MAVVAALLFWVWAQSNLPKPYHYQAAALTLPFWFGASGFVLFLRYLVAGQGRDARDFLMAALTAGLGAIAGYLAARPFWLTDRVPPWFPERLFASVLKAAQSFLGDWFRDGDGELMLATIIMGIPSVLIVGLILGC
ncbi:MAG TPA: hypothetical protein VHL60_12880, partial [Oxalicibacterium sp.]|nr:hypothetical protein [Oxalicibacterium sp.]